MVVSAPAATLEIHCAQLLVFVLDLLAIFIEVDVRIPRGTLLGVAGNAPMVGLHPRCPCKVLLFHLPRTL